MAKWEAIVLPYVEGYEAGLGLLRASGEPRNKAIKGLADGVTLTPGGRGTTYIKRIESTEELETELGINISARAGIGPFKAENKFEFSEKCKLQRYSLAILIKSDQQWGFIQIDELELTENAKQLAASNRQAFADEYGDCFIRGIHRGGQFHAVIRIDTSSEQNKQIIKNTLNASMGTFSGEAMVNLTEAVKRTNSFLQIFIDHIGGMAAPTSVSAPDQIANVVGPWISSIPDKSAPFGVMLASYKIVAGFDPLRPNEELHQQEVLKRCSERRYYALDGLNQVEYALDHPGDMVGGADALTLGNARAGFAFDLDVISQAASFALDNPTGALEPEGFARLKLLRPDYKVTSLPDMPKLHAGAQRHVDFFPWFEKRGSEDLSLDQRIIIAGVQSSIGAWDGSGITNEKKINDAVARLEALGFGSTDGRGRLEDSSISSLTELPDICSSPLRAFSVRSNRLKSLKGLEAYPALESVTIDQLYVQHPDLPYFVDGSVEDVSALRDLVGITQIKFIRNPITDISALAGASRLRRVEIHGTQIGSIEALRGKIAIEFLRLGRLQQRIMGGGELSENVPFEYTENPIRDASPLATLPLLQSPWTQSSQISLKIVALPRDHSGAIKILQSLADDRLGDVQVVNCTAVRLDDSTEFDLEGMSADQAQGIKLAELRTAERNGLAPVVWASLVLRPNSNLVTAATANKPSRGWTLQAIARELLTNLGDQGTYVNSPFYPDPPYYIGEAAVG